MDSRMKRFFDKESRILYEVGPKTQKKDLKKIFPAGAIEVNDKPVGSSKLRRCNAMNGKAPSFFSTESKRVYYNSTFDMNHPSNSDLIEIKEIKPCP
jgi:hypothetical protein